MNTAESVQQLVQQLQALGLDTYRNTLMKHGRRNPFSASKSKL